LSNGEHIRLEELELLALGALTESEAATLQAHVSGCDECARKVAQTRGSVSLLAFTANQEKPAATVKAELMARIRARREAEELNAWPAKIEGPSKEASKKRKQSAGWLNWVLVPVAAALALVSFGLSWQNRRITAELEKQRAAAETLIHDRQQMEKFVGVLAAPDTLTVKLAGVGDTASASGMVKYNSKSGIMLYAAQLPALPAGKSYQMWLVPANGAPISAGLLGATGHAWGNLWTAEVPVNTQAKAFAVTIEPAGGVPQPTGPKVLLGAT
jgi:anti-sigma-K factor RskA